MPDIRLANAPCSWGTLEFKGIAGKQIAYSQMLDELRATGYTGTELGNWGYMPTDAAALRSELESRKLSLRGAYVPVALADSTAHAEGADRAVRTALLLAAAGDADDPAVLVLADANGTDPARTKHAGRINPDMGLAPSAWDVFVRGAVAVARAVASATGLRTVFHHHCAGFVETPAEIAQFLSRTDPKDIGLVFDTGHYAFGAGSSRRVSEGLRRFGDRITYVHFKDCHDGIATESRRQGRGYFESIAQGVFCELGQGGVDFAATLQWLRQRQYQGWIVVEQDVLPGMGSPKESAARNRAFLRTIGL